MREKKYRIRLDEYERGVLINSLLEMRNGLVWDGKDADPINDLLLKIINAPKGLCLFRDGGLNMEKYIFDEKNGLWYELNGDYYLPCLTAPEGEQPIGIWGQRHLRYISQYQKARHATLLLTGKLNSYLAEVNTHAAQMLDSLVTQMAAKEGITEQLKAQDQMAWVGAMNSIRNRAEEIVNAEVIFV